MAIQRALAGGADVPAAALGAPDPATTARAREHLLQPLAAHAGGDGVWFDSRAWIVTARRR